ncbi:hypothetical protein K5549_002454, partial [Capra hircus]
MAAVAAASAELLIIGWYIFRVLLQVFLECCIYWVGFAFRNPPGTQPIARSEVFRYSLQKLAYTVSRTGRHVLGERRQRAPNPLPWAAASPGAPVPFHQHGSQRRAGMGRPLCPLARGALAKVSEGLVGPRRSSTDNDDNTRSLPHPFAPLPLGAQREQTLEIWAQATHSDLDQVGTAPSQPRSHGHANRPHHRDPDNYTSQQNGHSNITSRSP